MSFISNYLSKGGYDYRHIRHLIDYFNKLRPTSFEGNYFSTGLLISKAHFDYQVDGKKSGKTYSLKKNVSLANTVEVDRRFWYLVDGKKTFFIANKANHIIRYLSSDGATIVDKDGFLQYFGCIVDLGKIKIQGVKGTGESAAEALAHNGIAIKISQDGLIKIFNKPDSKPIII